jgi:antitoxin HicB
MSNHKHIGSDFDDFLKEENIFEEVEAIAIKKVVACMLLQAMNENNVTKSEMAMRMKTSRTQLNRLLDQNCHSVNLTTLTRAAAAVGKKISISVESCAA